MGAKTKKIKKDKIKSSNNFFAFVFTFAFVRSEHRLRSASFYYWVQYMRSIFLGNLGTDISDCRGHTTAPRGCHSCLWKYGSSNVSDQLCLPENISPEKRDSARNTSIN